MWQHGALYTSTLEFVPHQDSVLLPEHITHKVAIQEPHRDSHGEPDGDADAESHGDPTISPTADPSESPISSPTVYSELDALATRCAVHAVRRACRGNFGYVNGVVLQPVDVGQMHFVGLTREEKPRCSPWGTPIRNHGTAGRITTRITS